ncbi:MAG: exodeoxyribonuclease III [Deltaproteobacteria bacterium]|nr:exodeoxyribonuclease III [Deltaproteobacteria bacterium]
MLPPPKTTKTDLTISSWNVNGLRACVSKGFLTWLNNSGGQVVGLQEVRAFANQLPPELQAPQDWNPYYAAGVRPGYSGVGMLCRDKPDDVGSGLGIPEFDVEGRFQWLRFGKLVVANGYFPKGSGKERDNSRVPYKLKFYEAVFRFVEELRKAGTRVLVMGDFNTAHAEIDLARPASNHGTSGFLPEERAEFGRWLKAGWVDTFRTLHPEPGHYSWWSQRLGARARNVGWRIDYVLGCPEAMRFVKEAFISPTVQGSDHCPVGVVVDGSITG